MSKGSLRDKMKKAFASEVEAELKAEIDASIGAITDEAIGIGARAVAVLAASRLHQNSITGTAEDVIASAVVFERYILGQIEEG